MPSLEYDDKGERAFPGDCAVGSVETVGFLVGTNHDRALVKVRWSGTRYVENKHGGRNRKDAKSIRTDYYVLIRDHDVRTNMAHSLQASHCPGCGASPGRNPSPACEYCGLVINDGSLDWVLSYVGSQYDGYIEEFLEMIKEKKRSMAVPVDSPESDVKDTMAAAAPHYMNNHSARALAAWLIQVMLADGRIDMKAEQCINAFALKAGLKPQDIDDLIDASRNGRVELHAPDDSCRWQHHRCRAACPS